MIHVQKPQNLVRLTHLTLLYIYNKEKWPCIVYVSDNIGGPVLVWATNDGE